MNHLEKNILIERLEPIMNSHVEIDFSKLYRETFYRYVDDQEFTIKPSVLHHQVDHINSLKDVGFTGSMQLTVRFTIDSHNKSNDVIDASVNINYTANVFANLTDVNIDVKDINYVDVNMSTNKSKVNSILTKYLISDQDDIKSELRRIHQLYEKYIQDFKENDRKFKIDLNSTQLVEAVENLVNHSLYDDFKADIISSKLLSMKNIQAQESRILDQLEDSYEGFVYSNYFDDIVLDIDPDIEIDVKFREFTLNRFFKSTLHEKLNDVICIDDELVYDELMPSTNSKFMTYFYNQVNEKFSQSNEFLTEYLQHDSKSQFYNTYRDYCKEQYEKFINQELNDDYEVYFYIYDYLLSPHDEHLITLSIFMKDYFKHLFSEYLENYKEFLKTDIDAGIYD